MNRELYNKKIELPEEVVIYLKQCHDVVPSDNPNVEGLKRNKELRDSGYVTYQQLKRIKNYFDNFKGEKNDLTFILNGADYMKNWVDRTLDSMRSGNNLSKEIKSVVLPNQYIDPHQKNQKVNPDNHKTTLDKYNLEVTESLKRINDLIKKII